MLVQAKERDGLVLDKPLDEDDDIVVLENSETKEVDVKEDEFGYNKERYTFKDDDDDGEFDDLGSLWPHDRALAVQPRRVFGLQNSLPVDEDKPSEEDVSDTSKPPGFENFIKENSECSISSNASRSGKRKNYVEDFYIINVYGPQHQPDPGKVILFGDLNEVRNDSERFGSIFSSGDAAIFNDFIQESGLIDLPMGGRSFTWMNKDLLKAVVSMEEIKTTVWDYGSNKAPGPYGYSFLFIKDFGIF
uniref:RNA-directed DNA polymerase, eukaryota, reverse transcriptase zinc-binding domain protein n=1 Tax=Tanacetum cinerariifolium TaxID=118510 RepID=A0A6L2KAV4_TANCI|nr:RNA-directed DNA polymerase, eukaryota, reverse transcriptase zinc-binding domain protein [Tanacetum cinerariifolium]